MARYQLDPTIQDEPTVADGTHSDGVTIFSAEVKNVPGANENQEVFLDIAVTIPTSQGNVFVHTSPFGRGRHTRLTANSGSKAWGFLEALGVNPGDFSDEDLAGLKGKDVVVEVIGREYQGSRRLDLVNIATK